MHNTRTVRPRGHMYLNIHIFQMKKEQNNNNKIDWKYKWNLAIHGLYWITIKYCITDCRHKRVKCSTLCCGSELWWQLAEPEWTNTKQQLRWKWLHNKVLDAQKLNRNEMAVYSSNDAERNFMPQKCVYIKTKFVMHFNVNSYIVWCIDEAKFNGFRDD